MSDQPRYWAFISYSHQDDKAAERLHRALESYRVPRLLVGRSSRDGAVPKRLFPIFRDREELPGSADLGDNIGEALSAARYLIVVCSPRSAVSRWVNEEILAFKRLGRQDRILCLIIDGEPNASDRPDCGLLECFPMALRFELGADGTLSTTRCEPIAADARAGKDGRDNAKLKLVAGLLGVAYDELRQRERRRQRQRLAIVAALVGMALLVLAWGWSALRERNETERMVEAGRQALVADDQATAAVWLSTAYTRGADSPQLRFMLHRAMAVVDSQRLEFDSDCGPIESLEFSPDGELLALACNEQGLELRATADGALLHRLAIPTKHLREELRFSPDSQRLFTQGEDGVVLVWDVADGKILKKLMPPDDGGADFELSRDGSLVLRSDLEKVWAQRVSDGKYIATFNGYSEPRTGADNTLCVAAAGRTQLRRIADGKVLASFPGEGDCSFDDSGQLGLYYDNDLGNSGARARLFAGATGKLAAEVSVGLFGMRNAVFSHGGQFLLTGGMIGPASLRESSDGTPLATLAEHGGGELMLGEFMAGDWAVAVRGWTESAVRLVGVPRGRVLRQIRMPGGDRPLLRVSRARDELAAVTAARRVRIYSFSDLAARRTIDWPAEFKRVTPEAIDFALRHGLARYDDELRLVDLRDGHTLARLGTSSDDHWQRGVLADQTGSVATRFPGEPWRIHALDAARPVTLADSAAEDGNRGRFVAADTRFATVDDHGDLRVWDIASGALVAHRAAGRESIEDAAIRADGGRYAYSWHETVKGADGEDEYHLRIAVWDAVGGTPVLEFDDADKAASLRFGGRDLLITVTEHGDIVARRLPDGAVVKRWGGFDGYPSHPMVPPDERYLLVEGDDEYQVRDFADGRLLARLPTRWTTGDERWDARFEHAVVPDFGRGYATTWDLSPETREPAAIARLVECRVPLRVVAGQLVPMQPPDGCVAAPAAEPDPAR